VGKFILDPCVEDELWSIWNFIAADNPEAATRVIDAAYATFKNLAANPGLGRPRKFRHAGLRHVRSFPIPDFNNYLVFYRTVPEGIQVLHVYHGARDLETLFE